MSSDPGRLRSRYPPELQEDVRRWAEGQLDAQRLEHVLGTVQTGERLARRYCPEHVQTVRIAAWLHDVARRWQPAELLAYAEEHSIPVAASEREAPMLLHGAVGYALAAERFRIDDAAIESACRFHTVGDVSMGTADKVLFLADFIEPARRYPEVGYLRAEAEIDLDRAVLLAIDLTVAWFVEGHRQIDPRQIVLRNDLLRKGVRHRTIHAVHRQK